MPPDTLSTLISRIDFALISSVHILFPPLTIGLAIILFVSEALWVKTQDERWYRLCRFFEKLFIVNFGAGVATGVTMEMAFGILYGPFSQAAGPFFGQVLGYETITAFMYEAGFIGLMIFGWGKISRKMHLFATFNVALSSTLSAMWILVANSWMQTPTGVEFKDGIFEVTNWLAALFNPNVFAAFPHMLLAAVELSLTFVVAVCAWFVLKRRNVDLFLRPLKYALVALAVVAAVQVYMGDVLGENVLDNKPAALAAMEGQYDTYDKDGNVNNAWNIIGWPNKEGTGLAWSIKIPHALSLIETKTWNGAVEGLNSFPKDEQPPVVLPFYSFRVMAAIGGALLLLGLWGCWLRYRGQLTERLASQQRLFLMACTAAVALPYIAVIAGWWTREIGRQPWIVYGMMTVKDGMSHMSTALATFWLIGFAVFETAVVLGTIWFLLKVCRMGPDLTSPVAGEGHEHLGELDLPEAGKADHPEYVRPI
ncbi:cytochrome ubiquinol oxidase subunit I [Pseudooceanicola sp. CBS1P-1]|uniref:Cytochrome ubiquinol oxidase subunit I n=1 Tax=Pseudooceanicola albus TaxID=2692189 RepID=A0A6L7G7I9_9RHOB|nr:MULTISPECIES: cytochrome ubiquinol oxidase subunit I [Pseudooceanicola]MBT9382862.1 cytochrome ubiquinol oxidase subunit I [Pseudooceanicola endophyticus]MXN20214.1 cytochrome ubiquinol oxidase subunit I [Pseudooceanicola albus]